MYNGGPGRAQFTGTAKEKYGIFALFAAIIAFGVGSFITGAWQAAFGRRNKVLSWVLVAFAALIFAGGLAIIFLLK